MKKIVFFAVLMLSCVTGGFVYGQGTGVLYSNNFNGVANMIRYAPMYNMYVTYSWPSGSENHFGLTDIGGSNMFIDAHVTDNLIVKDFEVIDDYVFFCGYTMSNSGFLGWFSINDVFYSNGPVFIDNTLIGYGIENLENIEVFKDVAGNIHVAGYGSYTGPYGSPLYKGFESIGIPTGTMQYRVADIWCYYNIVDMTVTDNYVVYLSSMYSAPNAYMSMIVGLGVHLSPFPKFNMFASTTQHIFQFDPMVVLGPNMIDANEPLYPTTPKIVYVANDEVAVANYRREYIFSGGSLSTHNDFLALRTFDLAPWLLGNPVQMTVANGAFISSGLSLGMMYDFKYDATTMNYVVTYYHEKSTNVWDKAILDIDYSFTTSPTYANIDYLTVPNWQPYGLAMDGAGYCTVSGWDNSTFNYNFWYNQIPFTALGPCNSINRTQVKPLNLATHKHMEEEYQVKIWMPLTFDRYDPIEVMQTDNMVECE